jgi:TRAP-type C4-dicarboxylate transport system substrate-binding protein
VCNAAQYRSWPKDVQDAVHAAAKEATAYQRQLAAAEDAEIMKKLDPKENEVVELTEAERGAFRAAVQPVIDKYRRQLDPKWFAALGA